MTRRATTSTANTSLRTFFRVGSEVLQVTTAQTLCWRLEAMAQDHLDGGSGADQISGDSEAYNWSKCKRRSTTLDVQRHNSGQGMAMTGLTGVTARTGLMAGLVNRRSACLPAAGLPRAAMAMTALLARKATYA